MLVWATVRPFVQNDVLSPTYDYFLDGKKVTMEELLSEDFDPQTLPIGHLRFVMTRSIFMNSLDLDNPVLAGVAGELYWTGMERPTAPLFTIQSFHLFR